MVEQFTEIAEVLLIIAAIFGTGWGAHAFFHRKQHDDLKKKLKDLEEELKEAKDNQKLTVKIQNYTPQAIEQLKLSEDEVLLLIFTEKEGVFGPPDDISMSRAQLAAARLSEKGLIDDDQDGVHVTRLGLEWMEINKLLD